MISDPLNILQNNNFNALGRLMPDVNGNVNLLVPTDGASIYNGHSINNVLKNYGVKNPEKYDKL